MLQYLSPGPFNQHVAYSTNANKGDTISLEMFDITRVGDNHMTAFIGFIIKKIDFYEKNVQTLKNITGNLPPRQPQNFGSHD